MADSKAYKISKDDLFLISVCLNMLLTISILNLIQNKKESKTK